MHTKHPEVALVRASVVVVASVVLLGTASTAQAHRGSGTVTCTGRLTGVIAKNIAVPSGAHCWIDSALVKGAITVAGGALVIDDTKVNGAVTVSGINPFVAVTRSSLGGLNGTARRQMDQPGVAQVFLEKAQTGTTNLTMLSVPLDVHEVTVVGDLNVSGTGDNRLDTFRVTETLKIETGSMSGAVLMRMPIVGGSATVNGDWYGSVCGGRFAGDLNWTSLSPTVGTNGATCGGNEVKGDLSIVARSVNGPPSAWVSANVVSGRSTLHSYYAGGSGNSFLGGADAYLLQLRPFTVPDSPAFYFGEQRSQAQQVRDVARR